MAAKWIEQLIESPNVAANDTNRHFAVMLLARKTGDRYRDIPENARASAVDWLSANDASDAIVHLVQNVAELDAEQQSSAFGESLPSGLSLRS